MIKAIFFDIDGTLLSFKTHKVPQSTIEAIKTLKAKGIKVIVATGRAIKQVVGLDELEFDGYITFNGNLCLSKEKEVFFKNAIPKEDIQALIKYQQERKAFPCILMAEDENTINFVDNTVIEVFNLLNLPIYEAVGMEKATEKDVIQINAFLKPEEDADLIEHALKSCETSRWTHLFADVNVKGSNKGTAIDQFVKYLGINISETMAFGDGGNDIEMLKHAGLSVAMGNAGDDVKSAADYVTDSVDDNGIFNALKHFNVI
ncbi:Cof-type HAD-IIB family hydrolase [Pseudopedobacter beijingensis]|uniref:Cof-type HAD-IIB family hydrolase n=1 Tax=Pseudopedobacter beijingensis TaxID=1207056 RepID=A0ABW4IB85_9SPHI